MRVVVSATVFLFAATISADAQEPFVETATIVGFGVFVSSEFVEYIFDPKMLGGFAERYKQMKLVEETELVCPQRGVRFGIRYRLHGRPHLAPVPISVRVVFPEQGLVTPSGERRQTSELSVNRKIGETWGWTFTFSQDWHVVPGTWVFEVRHANRLLARKEFMVQCIIN